MTRFIHNDDLGTNKPVTISLTVIQNQPGKFYWFYSDSQILLGVGNTLLTIALEYIDKTGDGSTASITSYASTGFDNGVSPISTKGISVTDAGIITMLANQIIDFGVFVTVKNGKNTVATLFCDPQASNDPKLSNSTIDPLR